ncbi:MULTISPECIES: TetR/AcrR family transcriptional regulator [unclassified Geodermatophilus]
MPRGTDTRAALIRAATELVAEVGYHDATTRAIAERAGVAEGSIYRHFPDKRALFVAAAVEGQRGLTEWMADLPARAGGRPVADVLTEVFVELSRLRETVVPLELAMAATPELQRHLEGAALDETVRGLGGPPQLLADYLRAERDRGRVRADLDPTRTAVVLLATLFGVQTSPLAGPGGLDGPGIRELVSVFVDGIAPRPDPPARAG